MIAEPPSKPQPIPCCQRCGWPLVWTYAFRQAEFYCVNCGWKAGMFDALKAAPEPGLIALQETVKAEWEQLSEGLLSEGGMHRDCETCMSRSQPHELHATEAEIEAHKAAISRIWKRAGK